MWPFGSVVEDSRAPVACPLGVGTLATQREAMEAASGTAVLAKASQTLASGLLSGLQGSYDGFWKSIAG